MPTRNVQTMKPPRDAGPATLRSSEDLLPVQTGDQAKLLATVRRLIADRRKRERQFDASLFADPAWDILLDLFAAELAGRAACVSSLCAAAAVPVSTALRWLRILTHAGLIVRQDDRHDRRRVRVELSEIGRGKMEAYFRDLREPMKSSLGFIPDDECASIPTFAPCASRN